MNPLQYTSEEMFSSTELIRKSKLVFDKLHNKDIEKAIILRDGKPSFMLLDFSTYEEIMSEYLSLKKLFNKDEKTPISENDKKTKTTDTLSNIKNIQVDSLLESNQTNETNEIDKIDEEDLQKALEQIDNLDLEDFSSDVNKKNIKDEKESLKEFWE